jgi:hypothetical protein
MLALTVLLCSSLAQAAPLDTVVLVATDDDVYAFDVDGGGHISGALGVGPTDGVERSPGGAFGYGFSSSALRPWRVYAGHSSIVHALPGQRVDSPTALGPGPGPVLSFSTDGEHVLADWDELYNQQGQRWDLTPTSSADVLSVAVDPGLREVWGVVGVGAKRVDLLTGTVDAPAPFSLANPQIAAGTTELVAVGSVPFVEEALGEPTELQVVRFDGSGILAAGGLGLKADVVDIALDADRSRFWVLTDTALLLSVDVSGTPTLGKSWSVPDVVDISVDHDGKAWLVASTQLWSLERSDAFPSPVLASWTGDATGVAALGARTGLDDENDLVERFGGIVQGLRDEGHSLDSFPEEIPLDGEGFPPSLKAEVAEAVAEVPGDADAVALWLAVADFVGQDDPAGARWLLEAVASGGSCPACGVE